MKVISAETMQNLDRSAIESGIAGLELMENAGRQCAEAIVEAFAGKIPHRAAVVAGKGNNGGDGYVIARLLRRQGWDVHTFIVAEESDIAGDAAENLRHLDQSGTTFCPSPSFLEDVSRQLKNYPLIIDAFFGTGLKAPVSGLHSEIIASINASGHPVVSVDIPSGVHGSTGKILGSAVKASMTVTFAAAKAGHVLYPGTECCGKLVVADIGIPEALVVEAPGYDFVDASAAADLVRRRSATDHKGTFGHLLIVAGSRGKTGAAAMAANSAVRAGSGLVTLAVPASISDILEVKTTESMTLALPDHGNAFLDDSSAPTLFKSMEGKTAVAVGPGLSWQPETAALVRTLVEELTVPLVLDADALNAVSDDPGILKKYRGPALVLTPHPGEMARLCSTDVKSVEADRIKSAFDFAVAFNVHVILKGARTIIASPDGRVAINGSGNPGMASGGMGDVLTGLVASLLAQGYPAWDACRLGVFLHGHAADLVAAEKGNIGINATDVQERLPAAYKDILYGGSQ